MSNEQIQQPCEGRVETAQERFERIYVTSTEICERLKIARTSILHARKNGKLPDPIAINGDQMYIWERETVNPYIERWETVLGHRRGEPIV